MYVKDKYFYGASQRCGVWNPQLEVQTEYSAAATWLVNNVGNQVHFRHALLA
ncbi:hypothetical protein AMTR_s00016p00044380 [Amborella trichopoda]|uniref:Uncharacterized protein n=1 Tax=Amborella trichopoda TaxID=13333 RepID=W1P897_AMBTC|nr:hypothetical protein AMTR_s00016p00044380 [Amborella trichopoda]